jgi:sulfoxide reductase heme-binding subunit YedZ
MNRRNLVWIKTLVWLACLLPLLRLMYLGMTGGLGANPIEFITLSTGIWTLVLVLVTLSISPLRNLTGQNWLIRVRRLFGLFAFFYGALHFLIYIWLDHIFDIPAMVQDIVRRPFILAGFTAFVSMIPLAATSTAWSIRLLGGPRWQAVHRLIYVTGIAAVIHFWWKVKADTREPAVYAMVLAALYLYRVFSWNRDRQPGKKRHPVAAQARGGKRHR